MNNRIIATLIVVGATLFVLACAEVLDLRDLNEQVNPCTIDAPDSGVVFLTPASQSSTSSIDYGLAVDGTNVYWTNSDTNEVMVCSAVGCDGGTPIATNQLAPSGIAVYGGRLYWTNLGIFPDGGAAISGSGQVMECDLPCTNPTAIATNQNFPAAVALTDAAAYWVNGSTLNPSTQNPNDDGTVMMCALGATCGATPTMLAPAMNPIAIAIDTAGAYVYWLDDDANTVSFCATGGCKTPTIIAADQGGLWGIAADSTNAYWTGFGVGVLECPLGTSCVDAGPSLLASSKNATDIAVDCTNVYWTGGLSSNPKGGGTTVDIETCPVSGCQQAPTIVAPGLLSPTAIAVDSTSLYWVDEGDSRIVRLTPK